MFGTDQSEIFLNEFPFPFVTIWYHKLSFVTTSFTLGSIPPPETKFGPGLSEKFSQSYYPTIPYSNIKEVTVLQKDCDARSKGIGAKPHTDRRNNWI